MAADGSKSSGKSLTRILGPLDVRDADRSLKLAAGKQRSLLAMLLLHANEVVSRDRLIDAVWGRVLLRLQRPRSAFRSRSFARFSNRAGARVIPIGSY